MVKLEKWRDKMDQNRKRRGKVRELEGRGGWCISWSDSVKT